MLQLENLGAQATQPTSVPEGDPAAVLPFYISLDEANGLYPDGVNIQPDGTLLDKGTGQPVGTDPMQAAFNGSPIQVDALDETQMAELLEQLVDLNPQNVMYDYDSNLRDNLLAEQARREQAAAGSPDQTDQIPAVESPDASAGRRQRRGVMDWANDRITRMEQTAPIKAAAKQDRQDRKSAAKAAKKDLKQHKKLYPRLDEIATTDSETFEQGKAAVKAERGELEEQAGSYKAWRKAQRAEHGLVSKTVSKIRSGLHMAPEQRTVRKTAKQERNAARDIMATAHYRLMHINKRLENTELDATTRAELEAERTERLAAHEEAHGRLQANRRRAIGNTARKASEDDAVFDEYMPREVFPSDEARDLFKDLHDKRIAALKLGLESGYKLFKGNRAYKKAYTEYRKAYIACEKAMFDHAQAEAGDDWNEQKEHELAVQVVTNEIYAMENWQSQLAAEAQGTRRGRAAMWFSRQRLGTKILLGTAAGLATGGLAGLAGGAVAVTALATGKVARSNATRHASGLARQRGHQITAEDRARYFDENITTGEAFDRIASDQMNHARRNMRRKRFGVGLAIGSIFAGHWVGDKLNDHLHNSHGGGHTTAGRSGTRPGAGTEPGRGGTTAGQTPTTRDTIVRGLTPRGGSAGAAHLPEGGSTGGAIGTVAAEATGGGAHIDTSNFTYPWNWAESVAGTGHGGGLLQDLVAKAQAAGESVKWHGQGTSAWLEVNGRSDTDTVVNLLNKYR